MRPLTNPAGQQCGLKIFLIYVTRTTSTYVELIDFNKTYKTFKIKLGKFDIPVGLPTYILIGNLVVD